MHMIYMHIVFCQHLHGGSFRMWQSLFNTCYHWAMRQKRKAGLSFSNYQTSVIEEKIRRLNPRPPACWIYALALGCIPGTSSSQIDYFYNNECEDFFYFKSKLFMPNRTHRKHFLFRHIWEHQSLKFNLQWALFPKRTPRLSEMQSIKATQMAAVFKPLNKETLRGLRSKPYNQLKWPNSSMIFIPHKGLESPASKYTFQSHFRKGQGTLEGETGELWPGN